MFRIVLAHSVPPMFLKSYLISNIYQKLTRTVNLFVSIHLQFFTDSRECSLGLVWQVFIKVKYLICTFFLEILNVMLSDSNSFQLPLQLMLVLFIHSSKMLIIIIIYAQTGFLPYRVGYGICFKRFNK